MKLFVYSIALFFLLITSCHAELIIAYSSKNNKPSANQLVDMKTIQDISQSNKISITFKAKPWKRALLMLENGLIDGLINASYKPSRAKYAMYPMINETPDILKRLNDGASYYVYKHKDATIHWDGKKFIDPDGKVGVMEKFAVIEDLKKHNNIEMKKFTNNVDLIRKLAHKKIVAYAGTSKAVDKILKRYPQLAKNIVRESIPIRKKEYFLVFSKEIYQKKKKEINKIWNGLKEFNKLKSLKKY